MFVHARGATTIATVAVDDTATWVVRERKQRAAAMAHHTQTHATTMPMSGLMVEAVEMTVATKPRPTTSSSRYAGDVVPVPMQQLRTPLPLAGSQMCPCADVPPRIAEDQERAVEDAQGATPSSNSNDLSPCSKHEVAMVRRRYNKKMRAKIESLLIDEAKRLDEPIEQADRALEDCLVTVAEMEKEDPKTCRTLVRMVLKEHAAFASHTGLTDRLKAKRDELRIRDVGGMIKTPPPTARLSIHAWERLLCCDTLQSEVTCELP